MSDLQAGEIQITFPSQTQFVHLVTMMANNAATIAGFDRSVAGKVGIATDEAVTNVIKHAYGGKPDKTIRLKIRIDADGLVMWIYHTGDPLRKESIKLPDMEEYIKARRVGGLGLLLISKLMDEVDYVVGKEHCCLLKKYKNPGRDGGK